MTAPPRLTPKQAAEYIGMPLRTLYNRRSQKRLPIPFYKLGDGPKARIAYDRCDLDAWLASRKMEA